jgi:tetratricopeptide (TPR) repeat protein
VPAWNSHTRDWVRQGKLVVIGVAQEQHEKRCQLFAQWQQLDWPILYDPLNTMQVTGVPIEIAIDEYGIVRNLRARKESLSQDFLDKRYSADGVEGSSATPGRATKPDLQALQRRAEQANTSNAWRNLGDALVLWEGLPRIDQAIAAYAQAIRSEPNDGDAHFRLGTCYRMRYESPQRQREDFQQAVEHWTRARQIRPSQYIWRRRIEQYGPRLTKPYPFYDWVEAASTAIQARGEQPVALDTLPTGSEMARPARDFEAENQATPPNALDTIQSDSQPLILSEVTVVPPRVKPEKTVRVHVSLRPNDRLKAHWNNEAEPLKLWIELPEAWQALPRLLVASQPNQPESSEARTLEFELRTPAKAKGEYELRAHTWYYVCEDVAGTCRFLHQAIPIALTVDQ